MKTAILLIAYEEFPSFIGISTRVSGIASALFAAGHNIEIAAPCYSHKQEKIHTTAEGIKIHQVMLPNIFGKYKIPVISMILFSFLYAFYIFCYFRKHKRTFSFVQSEQIYAFLSSWILSKKLQSIIIIDDPDLLTYFVDEKLKRFKIINFITKYFARFYERFAFNTSNSIICSSKASVDYVSTNYKGAQKKLCLISSGIDTIEFSVAKTQAIKNKLFFNCSLPYYQNMAALSNIFKILKYFKTRNFTDYSITIIVNNLSYIPDDIVLEINGNKHVRILSAVPSLVPHIQESKFVLIPFEKGHSTTAGPRLKVLEALSCGKVILSTPEGIDGIEGCVGNTNMILCSDYKEMAEKIIDLMKNRKSNQEFINRLQKNARKLAENSYSWTSLIKAYEKILV